MNSGEIAAAVERGFRWNLWLGVLGVARRYAFTWLAGPYLVAVGADPLTTILTTLCVWFVERFTNRFTLTVHSTERIVDHWMRQSALGRAAFRWGNTQIALCLAGAAGLLLCRAGAPVYLCQMLFFSAMVAALYWAKTADFPPVLLHRPALARLFGPALRPVRSVFVGLSCLLGLMVWLLLPFSLWDKGGVMARDHADQPWVLAIAVLPLLGCAGHETLRFLLVRREMARLGEAEGGAG